MTDLQNESFHFANMRNFVTPVRKARRAQFVGIYPVNIFMLYLFHSKFVPFPAHMLM